MKKNQGFTLIELLTVIVILAVIALIATPLILRVIDKAKIGSAESSAIGYIEGIYNLIIEKNIEGEEFLDGNYIVTDVIFNDVKIKGNKPSEGKVTIENGKVIKGELCFSGYSIKYEKGQAKYEKEGGYCKGNYNYKITMNVLGNEIIKQIGVKNKTTMEVDKSKESEWINASCNNGAIPSYENGTVTITNISDDTFCKIGSSIKEVIDAADESKNTIIMLKDEIISDKIEIKANQNINLELYDKKIINSFSILNYGQLVINSNDENGKIISPVAVITPDGNSTTEINGGTYISTGNKDSIIGNWFSSCPDIAPKLTVNHATLTDIYGENTYFATAISNHCNIDVTLNDVTIDVNGNAIFSANEDNKIKINRSTLKSREYHTIRNGNGTIIIEDSKIIFTADKPAPIINNYGFGTIIMNGENQVDKISGVGSIFANTSTGNIIINGGNYIQNMGSSLLTNTSTGMININSGTYINNQSFPILDNQRLGTVRVCGGTFQGGNFHFSNSSTGKINYKENVIFKDPITPNFSGTNIAIDSTIICK